MSFIKSIAFIVLFFIAILSCKNDSQSKTTSKAQISVKSFHEAAYTGNTDEVMRALKAGVQPDISDENGQNALMLGAFNGHTGIVRLLAEAGVSVNVKDNTNRTALIFASTGPFPETVQFLIDNKVEINVFDNIEHFTALMFAASEGQLEVVKILMANGADASLKDIDGDTAETFARQNQHLSVAQYLASYNKN